MPISKAQPVRSNPGSFVFLGVVAAIWVIVGIWAGATLWPPPTQNVLGETTAGDKTAAIIAILVCAVGATVAAGASAIVHQVAQRRDHPGES